MLIISEETLSSHLKLGHHGNCTQKSLSPPLFERTHGPQRSWAIWKCKTATVQAITSLVSTTVNIMRGGEWRRIPLRIWHLICLMLDIERHRAVNNALNTQNTPNQKSLWAIAFLYIQFYVRGLKMSLHTIIRILSKKKSVMDWVEYYVMTIDWVLAKANAVWYITAPTRLNYFRGHIIYRRMRPKNMTWLIQFCISSRNQIQHNGGSVSALKGLAKGGSACGSTLKEGGSISNLRNRGVRLSTVRLSYTLPQHM